jgi:hypothetical protein
MVNFRWLNTDTTSSRLWPLRAKFIVSTGAGSEPSAITFCGVGMGAMRHQGSSAVGPHLGRLSCWTVSSSCRGNHAFPKPCWLFDHTFHRWSCGRRRPRARLHPSGACLKVGCCSSSMTDHEVATVQNAKGFPETWTFPTAGPANPEHLHVSLRAWCQHRTQDQLAEHLETKKAAVLEWTPAVLRVSLSRVADGSARVQAGSDM